MQRASLWYKLRSVSMLNRSYERLKHKEHPIYVVKHHKWAFAAWELEKMKGYIKPNATLVHVDAHLDNLPDGTQVEGLMSIKNKQDIFDVTDDPCMKIENFIWAGIAADSIQQVMYVSHQEYSSDDINDCIKIGYDEKEWQVMKETIARKDCTAFRFRYIEDFKTFMDNNVFEQVIKDRTVILDLDLDYFNISNNTISPELMSENEIYRSLYKLKKMYKWDMITVALSPHFCGGDDNAQMLLSYFYEVFELNEDHFELW